MAEDAIPARWRWALRAAAFAAMLAAGLIYRYGQPVDWDSWDYFAESVAGQRSDLLLGRWWFLAVLHGVWRICQALGADPLAALPVMQGVCAVFMAAAVVAGMCWTARLTRTATAEVLFAAMVLLGPVVGIYTYALMTEGLTLLALSASLWAWQRAVDGAPRPRTWALAAGLAFGLAVDIREPVVLLAAWPLVSCLAERPSRWGWLLAVFAAGAAASLAVGVAGAAASPPPWGGGYLAGIAQYAADMRAEAGRFPLSVAANAQYVFLYCAAAVPVTAVLALPATAWALATRRRRLWALAAACAPLAASMLANHDLPINVRHCLPLAWMLTPLAAAAVDAAIVSGRSRPAVRALGAAAGILAAGAMVLAAGWGTLRAVYFNYADAQSQAYRSMAALPADASIIPGPATPVAQCLNRLGAKRFDVVSSGWNWPSDIGAQIERRVRAGKDVYVFVDADQWQRVDRTSRQWRQLDGVLKQWRLTPAGGPFARLGAK